MLQNTRGFLASQLGRFDAIGQKRQEEHRDRAQLGDYIGARFDPLARLGQIQMGLPGGTSWGGVARANPTADWLLGHGSPYRNPFAPKEDPTKQPGSGGEGAFNPQQGPATPGANFGNPTGRDVEALLAGTPLQGYGGRIGQLAQQYGVPVALVMGILNAESSFTTSAGGAQNNFGGLKNADGSGTFASFPTVDQGLEAVIRNMGSSIYQGLSLGDYLNKYLGGPQGGDPAQYYSNVTGVIKRLGGNPDFASVPVGPPQRQGAAPGGNVALSADGFAFPVAGYAQSTVPLHWGTEHGGADLFAPVGTPVLSLGNGVVTDVSANSLGGNTVSLQLDNGLVVYMAHLRDPGMVKVGQRVQAGTPLGYVGQTGNAQGTSPHLHIGIGQNIVSGGGPTGGLGANFDATAWLTAILQQTRRTGAGGGGQNY